MSTLQLVLVALLLAAIVESRLRRIAARKRLNTPIRRRRAALWEREGILAELASSRGDFTYSDYFYLSPARTRKSFFTGSRTILPFYGTTFRLTPLSAQADDLARPSLWVFGGSTTFEPFLRDERTWVNVFARQLSIVGPPPRIYNFGCANFDSSLEAIKFIDLLRTVPQSQRPRWVIFYDGANEPGNDRVPRHWLAAHMLFAERSYFTLAAYALHRALSQHLELWTSLVTPVLKKVFKNRAVERPTHDERAVMHSNFCRSAERYVQNISIVRGLCTAFNIAPLFVLQPTLYSRTSRSDFENEISLEGRENSVQLYQLIREGLGGCKEFFDASGIFNDTEGPIFYDHCHSGRIGAERIGTVIGEEFLRRCQS